MISSRLAALGSPAELIRAASPLGIGAAPNHNSHIHLPPNFSAFANTAQAVGMAADEGCVLLGASNYYDYEVYAELAAAGADAGVYPLFGLEILCRDEAMAAAGVKVNDPGNPGKVYLCGKAITRFERPDAATQAILDIIRRTDGARMAAMVRQCVAALAERGLRLDLDADKVIDQVVTRHGSPRHTVHLQERHVAQALQEALFAAIPAAERSARLTTLLGAAPKLKGPDDAVGLQNEVRSHLMKAGKPGFVAESYISLDQAKQLALGLGGIPCYPVVADGVKPISLFEADAATLAANLQKLGIHACEFIPPRNAPEVLEAFVTGLRALGVLVTCGTEHNTRDLIPVQPACTGQAPMPAVVRAIAWEGACVCAGHQQAVASGADGYVLADGRLNPSFPSVDACIAHFASIGAEAIIRWRR